MQTQKPEFLSRMVEFDTRKALNQMEPTEQLQYYKKRLADISNEYFMLLDMIEKLKEDYSVSEFYQNKIFSLYDEVYILRKTVSDLQVQTLQEREYVMKLTLENEKLKIDLASCNRLANLGASGSESEYLWAPTRPELKELLVNNTKAHSAEQKSKITRELERTIEELNTHIENMKVKTENRSDIYAAEISCLMKDRELMRREFEKERDEFKNQIKVLQKRLWKMEKFNLGTLSDVAAIKAEYIAKETFWQKEFNGMLSHLRLCKELMGDRFPHLPECSYTTAAAVNSDDVAACKNRAEHALKLQLGQKNILISKYHQKCLELESEIDALCSMKSRLKHENTVKIGRMQEKIKFLRKHYEEEKNRRKYDAEGFHNELHLLKIEVERLKREMVVQSRILQKKEKGCPLSEKKCERYK